jgi:NAD(P)-dependent dehydrogenase (short-subunit alcohol dehydrogenase family)
MPKAFLVTGSSRGLGRAIVRAALEAGHLVAATARHSGQLASLAGEFGDRLLAYDVDVADDSAAPRAVAAAVRRFGRLDVLVNNAGYANVVPVEDMDMSDFRQQVDVNLMGVVSMSKAAIPVMREQGSGHIVTVSSVGSRSVAAGLSAYQAAKWGVAGFTSVLAMEVAPLGIKVTTLEPGGMRTEWSSPASMKTPPVSPWYQPTVGVMAQHLTGGGTQAAGDPRKVADAVLKVVELPQPPVRLLLGSDAYNYGRQSYLAQLESDEKWRSLTVSTDADDATEADLDPLAGLS